MRAMVDAVDSALNAMYASQERWEHAYNEWYNQVCYMFDYLEELKTKQDEAYANWNGDTEDCVEYRLIEALYEEMAKVIDDIHLSDDRDSYDFTSEANEKIEEALGDYYYEI